MLDLNRVRHCAYFFWVSYSFIWVNLVYSKYAYSLGIVFGYMGQFGADCTRAAAADIGSLPPHPGCAYFLPSPGTRDLSTSTHSSYASGPSIAMRSPVMHLAWLCAVCAALQPTPMAARLGHASPRSRHVFAREGAAGSGGMIDGVRIGPPPDMPSLLLNNRIVYLGMPISAPVSELIITELLYLQYDSNSKVIVTRKSMPHQCA